MNLVEVSAVTKYYYKGSEKFAATRDLTFSVARGEIVCVVGKTGCGKSTLINLLLGIDAPCEGTILIDGLSPSGNFDDMKSKLAAVFQSDRLLPWRTVADNAALGLEVRGIGRQARLAQAGAWLKLVGLEGWESAYPAQLSGGMRQRVAIARAFVLKPAVVLLDEAFGHLDEVTAHSLRKDCISLVAETQKTAIVVTHNITEALEMGSRILVLGRPASVLASLDITESKRSDDWPLQRDRIRDQIFKTLESQSVN
jgi:NitT/TauT family transport system ATP-binding protein